MTLKSKLLTFYLFIILAVIGVSLIQASERIYNITYPTTTITKTTISGLALSAALASVDCTYTTQKWHGGLGMGFYDGVGAPAIGLCKKMDGILFKGVVGRESENTAGSFSLMYQFE